ncbi:phd finger domain protein [Lasallia pustulata]|uniref:Phd finger domain protein n=1 Tax=Lasallia pustulata TaxID=136370 RepID=A0A1W5D7P1_9LECA|nr:phd finger domain protein [Lasallia pustulata]
MSRKRGRAEMEASHPPQELSLLDRLRNMWQFSNLMQYIFIFGKAVKIDEDFDIEDLETECVKPEPSEKLSEIGLALLKFVSSHRGLTPDIFDEYTRRQYVAKAPGRNPFGSEEAPNKFADFDIFTKIRVLFQLSQWTLRVEDIGMDKKNRLYFVLDDNRLYRRTDPPPPPPPPNTKAKGKSKKAKAGARASKRRKVIDTDESADNVEEEVAGDGQAAVAPEDDGFGGSKWECVAITLGQYRDFLETIRKSKNTDEKELHTRITEDVLPIIEKAEEAQQRKIARRERELMTLQKLATAKRSGRIASKMDKEREEREAAEAERKRQADLVEAKKEQERQKKMEEARESRMMTREQRLKEREYKRILHEEELANLSEDSRKLETGEARMSERHLKAEMEKRKKELDKLAQEDEWFFDCSKCGVHGENLDDGSHSVACEKCNVWQHSACLGISQADAEKDDFHFVCDDCKRREEDAKKPKIPALKFRLGSSSSPPSDQTIRLNGVADKSKKRKLEDEHAYLPPVKKFSHVHVQPNTIKSPSQGPPHVASNGMHGGLMNGPTLSPQGQLPLPPYQNGHITEGAPPPPGLASPLRPGSSANGYAQHVSQPNGYESQPHSQPNASLPNTPSAATHTSHGSPGSAWPAQYPPLLSAQHAQDHQQIPPQPPNPFLNSFDRQHPSSSHSTHNLASPMKNRLSMSPTQGNLETSAIVNPAHQPNTSIDTSSYLPGVAHTPGFSPTKQLSSPAAPLQAPPSSPIIRPPIDQQQQNRQSSLGLSPTKHSPPRPPSAPSMADTPVVPPVLDLSPSPRQQQTFQAPVKSPTPERPSEVNGS